MQRTQRRDKRSGERSSQPPKVKQYSPRIARTIMRREVPTRHVGVELMQRALLSMHPDLLYGIEERAMATRIGSGAVATEVQTSPPAGSTGATVEQASLQVDYSDRNVPPAELLTSAPLTKVGEQLAKEAADFLGSTIIEQEVVARV